MRAKRNQPCTASKLISNWSTQPFRDAACQKPHHETLCSPPQGSSTQLRETFLKIIMAKHSSPDGRLVYLHCSSIFSGANAHVRKAKAIAGVLKNHKHSIKILTQDLPYLLLLKLRRSCSKSKFLSLYPGQDFVSRSYSSLQRRKGLKEQLPKQKC